MTRLLTLVAVTATLFGACVTNPAVPQTPTGSPPTPRSIQICVDRSGSYDFPKRALSTVSDVLPRIAQSGDTLYLRWIESNSYAAAAGVKMSDGREATWQYPSVEPSPAPLPDLSDPRLVRRYHDAATRTADQQRWLDAVVASSADQIRQIVPPPSSDSTDVFGCITKACELLRRPGDVLWIASDLEDNVGRRVDCMLPAVSVIVTLFQCDVPCPEKRWYWASLFGRYGGASTTYLDPSLPLDAVATQIKEAAHGN